MGACRVCDAPLETFLELGTMPLADRFLTPGEVDDEYFYDLAVGVCPACALVQLVEVPDPRLVFPPDYPYRTSGSARMRAHFEGFARRLLAGPLRRPDPFVVELGSNDGALLAPVAAAGVRHLGVEPASEVAAVGACRGVAVMTAFFSAETAQEIHARHGPADVIYAANTLCHIADLRSALRGVDTLLAEDGLFVFEDPYLGDILTQTAFDQIYDEHVFYFSLAAVAGLLARYGLEVVDVEPLAVHGGELRYVAARAGRRPVGDAVGRQLQREEAQGLARRETLRAFSARVRRVQRRLRALLEALRRADRRVVGYGATAKSATVTNSCGIGPDLVEFVCDATPGKQGKLTPGVHLPVVPPEAFADPYPDDALLFAWNHAAEIMGKEAGFTAAGGRWLLYVPDVRVHAGGR